MLNCADATRRMSEGLDHDLPFSARMSLRMHVLMCGACRRYGRQIRGVEKLLKEYDTWKETDGETLPDEKKVPAPLRLSKGRRETIKRSLRS